jgi:hypothetical protein
MEIKFTIKKSVSGMGFYFMQVHFVLGSSSINKANSEKCIVYSVETSYIVTQLLIYWLDIIKVRHFHLELFKKLKHFYNQNQIIRHLPKLMAKAGLAVGYFIH